MRREDHPCQSPHAAWREVDEVVVIISPVDSVLHELNSTASFIWKHATGRYAIEEIARLLATEYDVDSDTALTDVEELTTHLEQKNLLLPSPPTPKEESGG